MRWLADFVYLLAGLAYLPVALYNALIVGKNRGGWGERFGRVRRFDTDRPRIWVHAVSLGEINATPHLVDLLQERHPDHEIVFSTTTDTGYARAVQLYGAQRVFRFPLDFSLVIARVLRRVNPTLIVLVELEVWHNLILLAARRGIPIAIVNGRLTERSARRLARLGVITRAMFGRLTWVGAQDEATAERFMRLGVARDRVEITSSLKWDSAQVTDEVDGAAAVAGAVGLDGVRPVWVCGSTGPGEEALILDVYHRMCEDAPVLARNVLPECEGTSNKTTHRAALVIVPRKPERFEEVARLIERAGYQCVRRSEHPDGRRAQPLPEDAVVLGDTMGELRKFYSFADVVFVGRTLVPMGGSDPMEVAALGKPVVVGPYTDNFRDPVAALDEADALRIVCDGEALGRSVALILSDPSLARGLGQRGREVVVQRQGATRRTVSRLGSLLDGGGS